jgi:hypothetical protein
MLTHQLKATTMTMRLVTMDLRQWRGPNNSRQQRSASTAASVGGTRPCNSLACAAVHSHHRGDSATRQKLYVRIQVNGKEKRLGYFDDEEAAARAYDKCVCINCGAHEGL